MGLISDLKDVGVGDMRPIYFIVGSTLMVAIIAVIVVAIFLRKTRLNWYERNLLEIAQAEPEFVRYKLSRTNTKDSESFGDKHRNSFGQEIDDDDDEIEDDDDELTSSYPQQHSSGGHRITRSKQQSRIYRDDEPGYQKPLKLNPIPANMSEKFVVPKSRSCTAGISMFQNLDKNQFNRELYDIRQDSSASEEQVTGECGSLKMALAFDTKLSLLTVSLRQAAELMAQRADGPPNPYFKVTLQKPEPNAHPFTQQSKVYRGTREPELADEFYFDVPMGFLSQCKLEVLVMDWDQCSVDECIGYCWLTLGRLDISTTPDNPPIVFWAEILPNETPSDNCGELLFSVAYLAKAQRLTVSIFKARKLEAKDMPIQPDPAVRVTVSNAGKRLKRKKTGAKKATLHPTYNEALAFNIPKSSLCDIVLDIEVIHDNGPLHGAIAAPKVLGRLQLPLSQCKDLWRAIIRGENSQSRWYPLEKPDKPVH